jgi:hypothetical protein
LCSFMNALFRCLRVVHQEGDLRLLVEHYLSLHLHSNALFLAERVRPNGELVAVTAVLTAWLLSFWDPRSSPPPPSMYIVSTRMHIAVCQAHAALVVLGQLHQLRVSGCCMLPVASCLRSPLCVGVCARLCGPLPQLFASNPSEVHRHLLACCLIYGGQRSRAVLLLKESVAPTNRYVQRSTTSAQTLLHAGYTSSLVTSAAPNGAPLLSHN